MSLTIQGPHYTTVYVSTLQIAIQLLAWVGAITTTITSIGMDREGGL